MNLAFEGRLFPPGRLGDNHAFGINKGRDSCIGHSNKISPVFDGPDRAEVEVVSIARRILPPSVVGDHADKALFFGQVSGAVGAEYGFIADNRQYANRSLRQYKSSARLTRTVGAGVPAKLQRVFPQKSQILYKVLRSTEGIDSSRAGEMAFSIVQQRTENPNLFRDATTVRQIAESAPECSGDGVSIDQAIFFRPAPALNFTVLEALILIGSFVRGLIPFRAARFATSSRAWPGHRVSATRGSFLVRA